MSDALRAYDRGYAFGARADHLSSEALQDVLVRTMEVLHLAWPSWSQHLPAVEYQFGVMDGLADILRRRKVPGLVEIGRRA